MLLEEADETGEVDVDDMVFGARVDQYVGTHGPTPLLRGTSGGSHE